MFSLPVLFRFLFFFFFNDTATTEIYTLSLHDALPISAGPAAKYVSRTASVTVTPVDLPVAVLASVDGVALPPFRRGGCGASVTVVVVPCAQPYPRELLAVSPLEFSRNQ